MLTPAQIIPFLSHDEPWVASHARRYLRDCHDPGSFTADDLWTAIDMLGENPRTLGHASDLDSAADTDRSVDRLLRALRETDDKSFQIHYQKAARNVDFPLLYARRDEILIHPKLLDHVRAHLFLRLDVADLPLSELWHRLESHGRSLGHCYSTQFNHSESDALIEAIGRHGYDAGPRALEIAVDPTAADDWREIFAVGVLGQARYAPAVPALVEKFDIDADVLREVTQTALARIGTPEVIDRIVAFYPGRRWDVRLYADEPIARIKCPESESALLQLLEVEDDIDLRIGLLMSLTALGSLRGLDASRALIAEESDNPEVRDLSEMLLAVATMTGVELAEAGTWRAWTESTQRRMDAMTPEIETTLARFRDAWLETGMHEPVDPNAADDRDDDMFSPRETIQARTPITEPIRRTAPKVGRNDPCTCGSGKKYKKCCMAK